MRRAGEPPGGSTAMTSAPRSARIWPQMTAPLFVRSRTRYGVSIGIARRLDSERDGDLDRARGLVGGGGERVVHRVEREVVSDQRAHRGQVRGQQPDRSLEVAG